MRLIKWLVVLVLMVVCAVGGWVVGRFDVATRAIPAASLPERERAFAERLTNASLVGRFTVDGRADRPAAPDRYDISSVEKLDEGRWRFNVRMQHGAVDVTLPIVMPVEWVGDVPAIMVSHYAIPGLGTFSAHVVFEGHRYGGTWSSPTVGGHMFGLIERQP